MSSAHDGTGRLFVVEKGGRVKVISRDGTVLPTPLIDLSARVSKGSEQGLLGLAFHPNFRTNGRFYVDFTNLAGATVINEYRLSPPGSNRVTLPGRRVLTIAQPYVNHNGGDIAFGPDGFLYVGMGDGGSAGDPGNRAQSLNTLLGKILRINVNGHTATRGYLIPSSNPYVGRAGRDEIWSHPDLVPTAADLVVWPAQPVALLDRSGDRRAVDRRRGPESIRGGRPLPEGGLPGRRTRQELRLAGSGRTPLLHPGNRLFEGRQDDAPDRVRPRQSEHE